MKTLRTDIPDLCELIKDNVEIPNSQEYIKVMPHHESWYNEQEAQCKAEEAIPPQYHEFMDVFDKVKSERFPKPKKWDHEIKLKEGFKPQNAKIYPLSP